MTYTIRSAALAVLLVTSLVPLAAQADDVDAAMTFFSDGGVYCFRAAPEGTSLSQETQWTIVMLTGAANPKNVCKLREMDGGTSKLRGDSLKQMGLVVTGLWRRDRTRDDFFDRFAAAIGSHQVRARTIVVTPPGLADMKPAARADAYLKFADRGSKVDFEKAADLDPGAFLTFRHYLPD